jgi:hypothetical protein
MARLHLSASRYIHLAELPKNLRAASLADLQFNDLCLAEIPKGSRRELFLNCKSMTSA